MRISKPARRSVRHGRCSCLVGICAKGDARPDIMSAFAWGIASRAFITCGSA
jgi:hypothetical protein